MFLGNDHLLKDFKKMAEANRLAHGYIFFGDPHIGKFTFALQLANFLEYKEFSTPVKNLSEVLVIKESGIDSVREIKNFLWKKPLNSLKRLVIVDDADSLTVEAQNAILKITEEPPENSLIVLIVSNVDNILPPIVSRLQKIYFSRISKKEILKVLIDEKSIKKDRAVEIAEMASGRPGRALGLIEKDFSEVEELIKKYLQSSGYAKSQFIKNFIEEQKEKPELLDEFFESLLYKLMKDPIKNSRFIKSVLSRLFLIKSYNVNRRLQIEAIVN